MITKTSQDWSIGSVVKVGFLKLEVTDIELTPGDHKPDAYLLRGIGDKNENKLYRFVPHNGLERL